MLRLFIKRFLRHICQTHIQKQNQCALQFIEPGLQQNLEIFCDWRWYFCCKI